MEANDVSAELSEVFSDSLQEWLLVSVMEMLVAKDLIVSFVPITSSSFSEVKVTKRATDVVSDEQLVNAFDSRLLLVVVVVVVVVFKAEAIFDFTFVTFSVAWYNPYKTFVKELELVLQDDM